MLWFSILSALAIAWLLALVALASSRRASRRLDQLQQSYWDLRYEHGRLKAQVQRLDPETATESEPEAAPATTTFIPLSSLKR